MRDSARVVSVPGDGSIEEIHEVIRQVVDSRLMARITHHERTIP